MESELLRDRIVCCIRDSSLRKQLLQKKTLTLTSCVDTCRASEVATQQIQSMSAEQEIHGVSQTVARSVKKPLAKAVTPLGDCRYCGLKHGRGRGKCPAFGKTCMTCGKPNHFSRVCQSVSSRAKTTTEKVRSVDNAAEGSSDSSDGEQQLMTVTLTPDEETVNRVSSSKYHRQIFATLLVKGNPRPVRFQLDTGATCNVIRKVDLPETQAIQPTTQKLSMYSQHKITPLGVCTLRVRNPKTKKKYIGEFVVVQEVQTSILGARSVQAMGLVTIAYDQIQFISERGNAPSPGCTDKEQIFDAYPEVFQGELGLFPGQVHLEVIPAVPTVQSPIRKIPLATRQLLREELNRLEQLDIIAKVDKPTDWVSSLVLVKKSQRDSPHLPRSQASEQGIETESLSCPNPR